MVLNKNPETAEEFCQLFVAIKTSEPYREPIGFGIARVDLGQKNLDKVLQVNFPVVNWGDNLASAAIFTAALQSSGVEVDSSGSEFVTEVNFDFIKTALEMFTPFLHKAKNDKHRNIQSIQYLNAKISRLLESLFSLDSNSDNFNKDFDDKMKDSINKKLNTFRVVFIYEDTEVQSVEAAYLKLYALSTGNAKLRSLNLAGIFGILTNVAWVGNKPFELDWLRKNEIALKFDGEYPAIDYVDKFPRFLQHVIPDDNTRILEASKVRMGAQLAAGTTVMPGASYINFNAGTLGCVMVEGRISSSAIVGAGSDVGGGASILGVLSGTDGNPISIGENTLLGANSVCGIPLGDACIIDGGLAIFAGTKIKVNSEELAKIIAANPDAKLDSKTIFRADEFQGLNGLHFRQNSTSGEFIVRRSTRELKLNADLH